MSQAPRQSRGLHPIRTAARRWRADTSADYRRAVGGYLESRLHGHSGSERSAKDARLWPSRSPRTSPVTWNPMACWTRRKSIASLPTRSCGRPVWDLARARRPARSPICAPFLHFSRCGRGPLPRQAASAGEQVAEAQVVCQVLKRLQMPIVGPHPSLPPTPYGDGVDAETTGDLHPRQAGRVLEPHQPLREVVWEGVGRSPVLCALSRHGANPCHGRPQAPPRRGCPSRQPRGAQASPFSRRPEAPTYQGRERPLPSQPSACTGFTVARFRVGAAAPGPAARPPIGKASPRWTSRCCRRRSTPGCGTPGYRYVPVPRPGTRSE